MGFYSLIVNHYFSFAIDNVDASFNTPACYNIKKDKFLIAHINRTLNRHLAVSI